MGWLQILTGLDDGVADYPFSRSDIGRYHALVARADERNLDDQTARDMLLDDYADRLGRDTSIFGRQMLHRRLRSGGDGTRVRALLAAPDLLARLGAICRPLRAAETEIAEHLFGEPLPPAPRWVRWLWTLPVAWLASIALAFVLPLGWIAAVALTLVLVAIQTAWHERAAEWDRVLLPLRTMLDVHQALGREPDDAGLLTPFVADAAAASKLRRRFELALGDRVPGQREYRDWLLQANVKRYCATRTALMEHRDFLRRSFELVAALEADCALARHLQDADVVCWAQPAARLTLQGVVHPLLAQPAPLDFELCEGEGAFISGQNGVGKSTLLRTVGINLIAARAFGFCYATVAHVPSVPVYASMQSEDAMDSGESLYMAELRRARELLALAAQGPAVFIIDEIFRGTNHLESVSAATAVLHELARHHVVIVSSHNLELAPLLRTRLAPFCVEARDGPVRVRPGVLVDTNGIRLLAGSGFDPAIGRDADIVFAWLSRHARGEDAGPVPVLGTVEETTRFGRAGGSFRA
jgi:MutS domain V